MIKREVLGIRVRQDAKRILNNMLVIDKKYLIGLYLIHNSEPKLLASYQNSILET